MRKFLLWGVLGLASVGMLACDDAVDEGGGGVPCVGSQCVGGLDPLLSVPSAQYLAVQTGEGFYWGGIANKALDTAKGTHAKLSLAVPPGGKAAETSGFAVDLPLTLRHAGDLRVAGITRSGEVVYDEGDSAFAATIDGQPSQAARLKLWNPEQDISTAVTLLQNRPYSEGQYQLDLVNEAVAFVETDPTAQKATLKLRTFAGAEETLAEGDKITLVSGTIAQPPAFSGTTSPTPVHYIPYGEALAHQGIVLAHIGTQLVSIDVATKAKQSIDGIVSVGYRVQRTSDGTHLVEVRTTEGATALYDLGLAQHLNVGKTAEIDAIYTVPFAAQEVVVATDPADSQPAEFRVFSLATQQTALTILKDQGATLLVSELIGGPKMRTQIRAVVAKYQDGYLVRLHDELCAAGTNSSDPSCDLLTVGLGLYHADGRLDRIATVADAHAHVLMVDPTSQRAVIRAKDEAGKQSAMVISLVDGALLGKVASASVAAVYPVDAVASFWSAASLQVVVQSAESGNQVSLLRRQDVGASADASALLQSLLTTTSSVQSIHAAERGAARGKAVVADIELVPANRTGR